MYRTLQEWKKDHEAHFEAGRKFHDHAAGCTHCHHEGGANWMLCRIGLALYRAADGLARTA